ncbi:MAG: 2-amino-4-hydroxy-6-hydroxymethyldihydropteridine diphosphokinase, partial [Pontibacterium sp.]
MANVLVSIGSNQAREKNITASLDALSARFGHLDLSSIYESESVGFQGENFYNLVAQFETNLSVSELSVYLKKLEDDNGRCRTDPKFSGRTLDIDILTYDDLTGNCEGIELPRGE